MSSFTFHLRFILTFTLYYRILTSILLTLSPSWTENVMEVTFPPSALHTQSQLFLPAAQIQALATFPMRPQKAGPDTKMSHL